MRRRSCPSSGLLVVGLVERRTGGILRCDGREPACDEIDDRGVHAEAASLGERVDGCFEFGLSPGI
jgi:hypothetical protein